MTYNIGDKVEICGPDEDGYNGYYGSNGVVQNIHNINSVLTYEVNMGGVCETFREENIKPQDWLSIGRTVEIVGTDVGGSLDYISLKGEIKDKIKHALSPNTEVKVEFPDQSFSWFYSMYLGPIVPFSQTLAGYFGISDIKPTIPNKNIMTRPYDGAIVEEVSGVEAEVYVDFTNINIRDTI